MANATQTSFMPNFFVTVCHTSRRQTVSSLSVEQTFVSVSHPYELFILFGLSIPLDKLYLYITPLPTSWLRILENRNSGNWRTWMGSAEKMVEQRDATSNGTNMQGTPIVILPWVVVVGSMSIELVPST